MLPGFEHKVTVRNYVGETTDARRRVVKLWAQVVVPAARVCILSAKERETLGGMGSDVKASILLPLDTAVATGSEIDVALGIRHLDGTYEVRAVQYTPHHLRALSDPV